MGHRKAMALIVAALTFLVLAFINFKQTKEISTGTDTTSKKIDSFLLVLDSVARINTAIGERVDTIYHEQIIKTHVIEKQANKQRHEIEKYPTIFTPNGFRDSVARKLLFGKEYYR